MSETREFVAGPEDARTRLDVFLARHMPDWSRSQIQRQIRSGMVTVGLEAVYKSGREMESNERVAIRAARHELQAVPEDLPVDILYEDGDLLVVNKPAGMVVHVGAGVKSGTLVNALLHHIGHLGQLSREGGELRPGIVHRLDRMTSGLLVVAKTDSAHRELSAQFKDRNVHKTYVALVHGRLEREAGEIERSVGRDPGHRTRMRAGGIRAREAKTRYRVICRFPYFTLVEAEPETGRTHQIRVHFSSIGHPIVGDTLYRAPGRITIGGKEEKTLSRNFLHAAAIEFSHPQGGGKMRFESPLPGELQHVLERLEAAG
ncbi:MAG TPA: RluA family pseudouridine synthase [Terriglobia bacterium]|nr:RluA family pseudouridine synthase [Terriglobia bacterium]